ncbi:MAG: Tn3 family transposase [Aridibacter sp.]
MSMVKEPSDERLATNWTLSTKDVQEVEKCRGEDNRRRFAIQLCYLRNEGRFVENFAEFPLKIINFISLQLGFSPVLLMTDSERGATDSTYRLRIQKYLGVDSVTDEIETDLRNLLKQEAVSGKREKEIKDLAERYLRERKVLLPTEKFFVKLVRQCLLFAQEDIFTQVAAVLSEEVGIELESLLEVENKRSQLFDLKEYPPKASATAILRYLEKYTFVKDLTKDKIDLSGIDPQLIKNLSSVCKRYNVWQIKRFAPAKRRALLACFISETEKLILDYLVEMHDQFLIEMIRHTKHSFEKKTKKAKGRVKGGVAVLTDAMMHLLTEAKTENDNQTLSLTPLESQEILKELFLKFGKSGLTEAVETCQEWQKIEEQGFLQEIRNYFSGLGKYFYKFAELPFEAVAGSTYLLEAIEIVRRLKNGEIKEIPASASIKFVPPNWRKGLYLKPKKGKDQQTIDRRLWLTALALSVRDALRAGTLYLPDSRRYVSFWNLVYQENEWQKERDNSYQMLSLEKNTAKLFSSLRQEFNEVYENFTETLAVNKFVALENGKLKLKRADALPIPEKTKKLKKVFESALPRIGIEDLLQTVNYLTAFSKQLRPPPGIRESSRHLKNTKLAALIAHGTNLGISTMGNSTEAVTLEMLQNVSRHYLNEITLKAANTTLVNYHHGLPLSSIWGDGTTSSSDGQRFGVQASSLIASYYPRYFGYYNKALTLYTHTSNQHSVFSTQVISCQPREALYVLDGLLENDNDLEPREHYTDTHGFTEQLFGLCYLLGFSFMPRLKDLTDQQLYKISKTDNYGELNVIFRQSIDWQLIEEQYDQLVKVAASLKNKTAPAHTVLQRLINATPADHISKALTQLGRIVKTIFILKYLSEEKLRRKVQKQLNRGEQRHGLAKHLFFANHGEFRTGDYEEIMNKASCLSLLSNAALVWNTIEMKKIVDQMKLGGEEINYKDIAGVSPLLFRHIIPNGTYHFREDNEEDIIALNTLE